MLNDEFKRVNGELLPGEVERAASATEMTGMIPSAIQDDITARRYEQLAPMHAQKPAADRDYLENGAETNEKSNR